MSRARRYTDTQLQNAVAENKNMSSTLRSLGLVTTSGNFRLTKIHIARLHIDTAHWIPYSAPGRPNPDTTLPLSDLLIKDSKYHNGTHLKRRLFKAGLLKNECYLCGITNWQGKHISLQLDHINGDSRDNRIENLRILCPNCHSQTITYSGRNKLQNKIRQCNICNKVINIPAKKCQDCATLRRQAGIEKRKFRQDGEAA